MAEKVGSIYYQVDLDDNSYNQGVNRVKGSNADLEKNFTSTMDNIGSKLMSVGKKMTLGVTLPVAFAAKSLFTAASDMGESIDKLDIVFGESSKEIQKWADTAAKTMGMSKQQTIEATGTYGNLFQAFGLGKGKAKDMSMSLVKLAADMASFNNTSVDDAIIALRSGLSGETEPLKRFGISLNDTRLKIEALKLGLISNTSDALDPAAKAQAAYSIIMQDSTLQQGNYLQTADSAANRTKTLGAQFQDMKAKLGELLIPAVMKLVSWLTKLVNWINKLPTPLKEGLLIFIGVAAVVGPLATLLGGLVKTIGLLSKALTFLTSSPMGLIIAAIALLVAGIIYLWNTNEDFRKAVTKAWDVISEVITTVWKVIEPIWSIIYDILVNVLIPAFELLGTVISTVFNIISTTVSWVWNNVLKPILETLAWIMNNVVIPIWDALKTAFVNAWEFMKAIIGPIVDFIVGAIEMVTNAVGSLIDGLGGIAGSLDDITSKLSNMQKIKGKMFEGLAAGGIKQTAGPPAPKKSTASGGTLGGRELTLLGEQGPELFVPDTPGHIIDAQRTAGLLKHAMKTSSQAGSTVVKINVDASGIMAVSQSHKREVAAGLIEALNQELVGRGISPLADNKVRSAT